MKVKLNAVFILSIVFTLSLLSCLGYYVINRNSLWRVFNIYDLKEYQLDIIKTIPINSAKTIELVRGEYELIESELPDGSNVITVQINGTALSTEKYALPYIFMKDEGDAVYISIHSGISTKKLLKNTGYYREKYTLTIFAPHDCFPVHKAGKETELLIEALQEKLSNSMEREPSDKEIVELFARFVDAVKNYETNTIAELINPIEGLDSMLTVEGRIGFVEWMFEYGYPHIFNNHWNYRITKIKKVVLKEKTLYLMNAEYEEDGKWHPYSANFWFRIVEGKLGVENID